LAIDYLSDAKTMIAMTSSATTELPIDLITIRSVLNVPLLCDALDAIGLRNQVPRLSLSSLTKPNAFLFGRARTTLWCDMSHADPTPYALELAAVDSCEADDVMVCAAAGSMRSGIWGELLTTAVKARGCVGAIIDGAIRDTAKIASMNFPVFARGTNPYDSRDRQRVVDANVPIELDRVIVHPGDWIAADIDGLVVVPARVAGDVVQSAYEKAIAENKVREALSSGMSATDAFEKFGVL
jgi:4-hydroxy-4-methyl-2-oxoglutarate aldolase